LQKGKANGEGKAEGTDQYLGEFKDGLPHGKGVYRWKNRNQFDGNWTNGKKDGLGTMSYKRNGKTDSLVAGFWKKGQYIGKHENPYIVHSQTSRISKSQIKFEISPEREIIIKIGNITGNMGSLGKEVTPLPELYEVRILDGGYLRLIKFYQTSKQIAYKLEAITYPFRAKFNIQNQELEVEFHEEVRYTLDIALFN